ncbi:hypothetical protein AGMMS49957_18570 [Synergistales bacterium]|nr:hypothetical protein AGMMS49957_18570 [Synergistales bacterium]
MSEYFINGKPYWYHICPFCLKREAVIFGEGLVRACRFCGARWDECNVTDGRFIEPKCDMHMKESPIMGVTHIAWKFAESVSIAAKQEVKKEEKVVSEPKALQVFSFEGKETRVVMKDGL